MQRELSLISPNYVQMSAGPDTNPASGPAIVSRLFRLTRTPKTHKCDT